MSEVADKLPFGDKRALCRTSEITAIDDLQNNKRPITDVWFKKRKQQSIKSHALRIGNLSITTMSATPLHFETASDPQLTVVLPIQGAGTILEGMRVTRWTGQHQIITSSFCNPMICDYGHFSSVTVRPDVDVLTSYLQSREPRLKGIRDRLLTLPVHLTAARTNEVDYGAMLRRIISIINGADCDEGFLERIGIADVTTRLVGEVVALQMGQSRGGEGPVHRADARALDAVCAHIRQNMGAVTTMSRMEAIAMVPYRALAAAFQERFNCTPMEWQRSMLLDESRRRLKRPDDPPAINALSSELGFVSPASFRAHYRKRFGELPSRTVARWRHRSP